MGSVRWRDDNSHGKVQNVRGDSSASHLVAGNVNLALVKRVLGHRSISSTMVYVGTTDAQAAEAVQAALMGVF